MVGAFDGIATSGLDAVNVINLGFDGMRRNVGDLRLDIEGLSSIRVAPIVVPISVNQHAAAGGLSVDAQAIVNSLDQKTRQELETARLIRDAA